jgi:hypothetical protein
VFFFKACVRNDRSTIASSVITSITTIRLQRFEASIGSGGFVTADFSGAVLLHARSAPWRTKDYTSSDS